MFYDFFINFLKVLNIILEKGSWVFILGCYCIVNIGNVLCIIILMVLLICFFIILNEGVIFLMV